MEQKKARFSAAVLAGGMSSRMKRDKASLPFAGVTLLAYQVGKLRALGIEDIMISGSASEIPKTRAVPDVYPRRGPLSGIHASLKSAQHDAVLFLSVDTPLVPAETLNRLLTAHEVGVTLLRYGKRTEPLIGVYDRSLAPLCEEILRGDYTSVWQLLNQTAVKTVPYDGDEALLLNCNTLEDYTRLLQLWERQNSV